MKELEFTYIDHVVLSFDAEHGEEEISKVWSEAAYHKVKWQCYTVDITSMSLI